MLTPTANWLAANAKFEKLIVYRIVISGYGRSFSNYDNGTDDPWIVSMDEHDKNINDLEGGADQETFCFTIQDRNQAITKDMGAGTIFEGSKVQLYVGFKGLGLGDFLLYWQGYCDQVDSANANLEYYFQCSDVTSKLAQVVYTVGDDGGPTSAANPKTLTGHPLNILLDILQNQLRDPRSGLALDQTLINATKINNYISGPFSGFEMLFRLSQPVQALDFIKNQILKPLGGYLWVSQGQLTVNFFYPLAQASAVQTLGEADFTTIPLAEQTAMINTLVWQFDKDDSSKGSSGNFLSSNTQEYGPSVVKYGLYGEHQIASDGLRAGLQGYLISNLVSFLYFGRYGFKNLQFDKNASPGIFTDILLEPGDVVAVTHPLIPDRQLGVMGITNRLFEVLHKKTNFTEGLITLSMIDATYLTKFGFREIAPDGEANYTSASSGDKQLYMFQSSAAGKMSNGDAGGVLG